MWTLCHILEYSAIINSVKTETRAEATIKTEWEWVCVCVHVWAWECTCSSVGTKHRHDPPGSSEPSPRALGLGALREGEFPEPGFLKGCWEGRQAFGLLLPSSSQQPFVSPTCTPPGMSTKALERHVVLRWIHSRDLGGSPQPGWWWSPKCRSSDVRGQTAKARKPFPTTCVRNKAPQHRAKK